MKHLKKISFLLLMLCLVVLLAGCQDGGSDTDGAGNNESEMSQETRSNASDIDAADTNQADTEETTSTEGVADYPAAIMVNGTIYLLEGGIAVFYQNEWYLATPFSNVNNNVSSPIDGVTMEVLNHIAIHHRYSLIPLIKLGL